MTFTLLAQQPPPPEYFAWGGLLCVLPFLLIGVLGTVFWIWMLIDCLTNEPSGTEKVVWAIVILFTHFLGALLYFIIRRSQRPRGQP